jgi:hypothetical protein
VLENAGMQVEERRFRNRLPLAHILFIAKKSAGQNRSGHSGGRAMMVRFMRLVGRLVVGHPGLVAALSLVVTLLLYANIHNLRTGTDLTDLFGNRDPQWRAASQIGKELGYGNQLFVVIEAPAGGTDRPPARWKKWPTVSPPTCNQRAVPACALRLAGRRTAQHGAVLYLELSVIRAARANGRSEATAGSATDSSNRSPRGHRTGHAVLVLGTNYFVADPLGLMEVETRNSRGFRSSPISTSTGDLGTGSSAKTTRRCSSLPNLASRPWITSSPSKSCNGRESTSSR